MSFVPLGAAVLPHGGVVQQPSIEAPRFTSAASELVVLPVSVVDRNARPVPDLPKERFVVYDNGRPQPIVIFSNEDVPVAVGLLIDESQSMGSKFGEVVAAALTFARGSNPHDEVFALAFGDSVRDAAPGQPLVASDLSGLETALSSLRPRGRTALYDALVAGLDRLAEARAPRKVLIVISDGGDNASAASLDDVLRRARSSNVTIYTIGLFDRDERDINPGVLKSLARTTGGERFMPESAGPLIQVCRQLAREIRSGYTIGYVPPDRDGAYHRVRVEIQPAERHISTRTRPGYFAAGRISEP